MNEKNNFVECSQNSIQFYPKMAMQSRKNYLLWHRSIQLSIREFLTKKIPLLYKHCSVWEYGYSGIHC